MKILFLGDVMGRSGRTAIAEGLPGLRSRLQADFVVVNCENATLGRGVTPAHARVLLAAGIDCMTLGDHAFDQREMLQYAQNEPRILRPLNFARKAPGRGFGVFKDSKGRNVLVMSALGRIFMNKPIDDPFPGIEMCLHKYRCGITVAASILDFHAEATSEKQSMGHWCDGKVSLVAGTHTHVPTADARILKAGTAFISDVGMCGDYDSVIGVEKATPISRFESGMRTGKLSPARGEATMSGVVVETDDHSGMAISIAPVFQGGAFAR